MMRRIIGIFLLFFLCIISLYPKYHPGIKWKEIRSEKFIVIYPKGYENPAEYTLENCKILFNDLKRFWGWGVRRNIRILLTDSSDIASMRSTFFPYNQIEISISPPEPESLFGNWDSWLKDALRFELNSLFILNAGTDLIYGLRKNFGFNTMFFPAGYIPGWIFAGLSSLDGDRSGVNVMVDNRFLDHGVESYIMKYGKFPDISSLKGNFQKWPGNLSKYYFGIYFVKYLHRVYGKKYLKEFIKNFIEHPLPLAVRKRFRLTFGEDIKKVALKLKADPEPQEKNRNSVIRFSTKSGYIKKYPLILPRERVVYFEDNFSNSPSLVVLDHKSGRKRRIVTRVDIKGMSYDPKDKRIYYASADNFRSFFYYSDIYSVDPEGKKRIRFSKGARLTFPVSRENSIFAIQRRIDRSYVVRIEKKTGEISDISGPFEYLSGLSLSLDGNYLAVNVKSVSSKWKILIKDLKGGRSFFVRDESEKSFIPKWSSSDELFFLSVKEGETYLNKINLSEMVLTEFKNPLLVSVRGFDADENGKIEVTALTGGGYDLGYLDTERCEKKVEKSALEKVIGYNITPSTKKFFKYGYDPFRDFLPQYITLIFRMGGNEVQPGFVVSGFDSIWKHYFKAKIMRGFSTQSWNSYFNYLYDENFGTFGFKYTNYTDLNSDELNGSFFKWREKFRFSYLYPLLTSRRADLSFYADLHFESESETLNGKSESEKKHFNGFRAGISFDSAAEYYDAHSPEDGIKFTLSYSRELKRLGSEFNINTASLEFRQFVTILRPNTLAVRFVIADSWGEGEKRFYLGGVHRNDGIEYAGENHFDLMRGYPSGYFSGNGGYLLNIEYRMILGKIERSFLMMKSLERIYLSLFVDAGRVWDGFRTGKNAVSIGCELNLIAFIGRYRYTFTTGIGYGVKPEHTPMFFVRIGNSF